ncbi:MAG: hypothetical protein OCD01_17110 [Fibrobacterales bacterium]
MGTPLSSTIFIKESSGGSLSPFSSEFSELFESSQISESSEESGTSGDFGKIEYSFTITNITDSTIDRKLEMNYCEDGQLQSLDQSGSKQYRLRNDTLLLEQTPCVYLVYVENTSTTLYGRWLFAGYTEGPEYAEHRYCSEDLDTAQADIDFDEFSVYITIDETTITKSAYIQKDCYLEWSNPQEYWDYSCNSASYSNGPWEYTQEVSYPKNQVKRSASDNTNACLTAFDIPLTQTSCMLLQYFEDCLDTHSIDTPVW